MKTLFQMGFPTGFTFWDHQPVMGRRSVLGQATPTGNLDKAGRDALLARMKSWVDRVMEVDAWIHSVGDKQSAILGNYYQPFRDYVDEAADLAEVFYPDYQRLASSNPADWYIGDEDGPVIDRFYTIADGAYQIYNQRVKGTPGAAAVQPTPAPKPGSVTQVPSGRPGAAPGAAPAAAPAGGKGIQPSSGVSTNDLLIGGGLAVGVGAILYAVLNKA
jgi:hypothetical protein